MLEAITQTIARTVQLAKIAVKATRLAHPSDRQYRAGELSHTGAYYAMPVMTDELQAAMGAPPIPVHLQPAAKIRVERMNELQTAAAYLAIELQRLATTSDADYAQQVTDLGLLDIGSDADEAVQQIEGEEFLLGGLWRDGVN